MRDDIESKSHVLGECRLDEVDAKTNSLRDRSEIVLSAIWNAGLSIFDVLVDLHDVQSHQFSHMGNFPHDQVRLFFTESAPELGSRSWSEVRLRCVDVERNMEISVARGVEIVDCLVDDFSDAQISHMVHREAFDVVLLEVDPLIGIDVSDGDEDYIFERNEIGQPGEAGERREAGHVGNGVAMVAVIVAEIVIDEIGMRVHPDNLKIFVVGMQSMEGGTSD